jgi:putative ABC transport system permease protein
MTHTILLTIIRNIRKNAVFSLINIFGLTLGIASFILIMLFILSELSYDRYNEKAGRVYRLCIRARIGDTKINQTYSSARMFREMREKYPEIESGVKFFNWGEALIRIGEKNFSEPMVMFADSTVFNVFTLKLHSGNAVTAINRPNTMVISETAAKKYFGDQNPVGKSIEMDLGRGGMTRFEVTGIYADLPSNSHIHFNLLVSLSSFPRMLADQDWTSNNYTTYFLLKPGASAKELENKLKLYVLESIGVKNYRQALASGNFWEFFLQPLTSIHLHSDLNGEFEPNGNIKYVYIFIVIAFFVLIIACINFMNLSTAKSTLRAREVGIRKTAGSTRGKLISQFLSESVIMTFVSLVLAIVIVQVVLPVYGNWLGRELSFKLFSSPYMIPGLLMFGFIVGIIAGLYPAFFLSSFSPTKVLKDQTLAETKGIGLRNILVIFQFSASIFLIIGTLIVNRQMNFIQNKDVGFIHKNILILRTPASYGRVSKAFENEIRQQAGVVGMTASSSLPGFSFVNWGFGAVGVDKQFSLNVITCDAGFEKTMGFRMVEGRFFSPEFPTDFSGIILNETAVRVLGLKKPIGTKMFNGKMPPDNYHVIGVVKDFNYESVHSQIRPMGLVNLNGSPGSYISIRYESGRSEEITGSVKRIWEKLLPGIPISYSYMEDDYKNLYRNEAQTKQVFTMLAGLAIIVAILGLLGLASFMAQRRTREIAIRKVSGAGVVQIINLLTWKFVKWVLISFVLACPVAWWVMNRWLQDFAYRVSLNAWVFIFSGIIALFLVIITVCIVTFRAASVNPAESMKYE